MLNVEVLRTKKSFYYLLFYYERNNHQSYLPSIGQQKLCLAWLVVSLSKTQRSQWRSSAKAWSTWTQLSWTETSPPNTSLWSWRTLGPTTWIFCTHPYTKNSNNHMCYCFRLVQLWFNQFSCELCNSKPEELIQRNVLSFYPGRKRVSFWKFRLCPDPNLKFKIIIHYWWLENLTWGSQGDNPVSHAPEAHTSQIK